MRPTLILLVGIPGSGKTTYATKYISEHKNTIHLSSDLIRKELWGDEATQGDNNEVFSLMQKRAIEALNNGQSVIYDATNITRKDRAYIISQCPKFAKIEAHIIWAPIETCIELDAARRRTVGKEVIDRMLKRFQAPFYDEGIDEICIRVSCDFDGVNYLNRCVNAMEIPHDNPHHTLNIDDHCAKAARHIAENNGCDKLIIATALHDIGKPYVKSFTDSKGQPCEHAHYYQHQCVGAWMCCGFGDYYDVDPEFVWLISTHMEPFFESKYYKNLPAYLKNKIDLLHEADLAAH